MDPFGSNPMEDVLSMQSYATAGEDHDFINTSSCSTTVMCTGGPSVTSICGVPGSSSCHTYGCPPYSSDQPNQ
jgi:hypothetical protein